MTCYLGAGLYIRKMEDGNVIFIKKETGIIGSPIEWETLISSDDWVNIVALMSKDGDTIANTMLAKNLHEGKIYSIGLLDEKYKQVIEGEDKTQGKTLMEILSNLEEHY